MVAAASLTLLWLKLIGYLKIYSTKIGIYISCLIQIFRDVRGIPTRSGIPTALPTVQDKRTQCGSLLEPGS